MSAAVVTATDPVRATAMVADTAVVVTAIQPRSCRRTVYDTVERASRRTQIIAAVVDRPCALPAANTRLHITLASGTVVDGTTDERGELVVVLPVSEPAGDVTVVVDQRGR